MQLPKAPRVIAGRECTDGFELAFDQACGDWLDAQPGLPVIACGMVGSAQGWREAAYRDTPANVATLGTALQTVRSLRGVDVHIVPGVIQRSRLPNVMRGEETQVLGVLQTLPDEAGADLLIGLPGSHSKWVEVVDGCIVHFDTFMTGEVFAVLSEHSILGRTQQRGGRSMTKRLTAACKWRCRRTANRCALDHVQRSHPGLTGELAPPQPDYLSGLLIGHELAALPRPATSAQQCAPAIDHPHRQRATLRPLQPCPRRLRFARVTLAEQATERGLWQLALAAGLITPNPSR
jgi:2-dehydro-3-deoxygalactonokinase